MKKIILLAAFFLAMTAMPAEAVVIAIDDFSDPSLVYLLPAYGVTATQKDSGLSGVVGGSRQIDYTRYHQWIPSDISAGLDLGDSFIINSGWYNGDYVSWASMSCSSGGWGKFYLTYDGDGGGLNLDLSQADHFDVNFWADHLGFEKSSIMSFTLTDGNGSSYTYAKSWDSYVLVQEWRDELFPVSVFAANGIDLSTIQTIQFYYEGDMANDLAFDGIMIDPPNGDEPRVPEPSTAALVFISLGGVLRLCRKRRHA